MYGVVVERYAVSITIFNNNVRITDKFKNMRKRLHFHISLQSFLTNTLSKGFSVFGSNFSFLYQGAVNLDQSLWSFEGKNVHSPFPLMCSPALDTLCLTSCAINLIGCGSSTNSEPGSINVLGLYIGFLIVQAQWS